MTNIRELFARKKLAVTAVMILVLAASQSGASSSDAKVARGKYLAIAGNCVSCHTSGGGRPYAGGRPFRTPFGTIYSTNITSDAQTGIGRWTLHDFARALRDGVRPDGVNLYPAFPYTAYSKMTNEDVAALYAYFKSIEPVVSAPTENELRFPYSQRWALSVWKALYHEAGEYKPDASRSAEWNRGAYLVEALSHCGACHSPRNFLGGQSAEQAMTGGEYTDRVPGGELREWAAPNLTPSPNGLGAWSVDELAAYLKTGQNSHTQTFGPMNEVIMNSTRHLSDADVQSMATYLKSLPSSPGDIGSPAAEGVLAEGSALYDVHCGTCHLPTGLGGQDEDSGARLVGSPIVQASNPASLINVIVYGPERPPSSSPQRWKEMPAFAEKLTDEEIAAIASFIRNSWGNKAGQVTAKDVEEQR
jgi:mono/diheme cytochrome c family protein